MIPMRRLRTMAATMTEAVTVDIPRPMIVETIRLQMTADPRPLMTVEPRLPTEMEMVLLPTMITLKQLPPLRTRGTQRRRQINGGRPPTNLLQLRQPTTTTIQQRRFGPIPQPQTSLHRQSKLRCLQRPTRQQRAYLRQRRHRRHLKIARQEV